MTDRADLTHDEAVRMVLNDPALRPAPTPLQVEREKLYAESAGEIMAELAEAGFDGLGRVGELYARRLDYRSAVPILVSWLPRGGYLFLAEEVARALCFAFARTAARPAFLRLFRDPPPVTDPLRPATSESPREHLRWVYGYGLGVFADPSVADEYIELALDQRYGRARGEIVHLLPMIRDDRVADVLVGLLDDPTVPQYALKGLGRMMFQPARQRIRGMLDHPDENVRTEARKALKRLDGCGTGTPAARDRPAT